MKYLLYHKGCPKYVKFCFCNILAMFQLKWSDTAGHGEHYYDYNHVGAPEVKAPYGPPPPKPAYGPSN